MNKDVKYILVLIILAYFFFFFGNGVVSLTNPDEVFYAQTAKEMAQHHSWLTPILFDEPQFEKPILIYWFLRSAFLIFGVSSFAARFFPACFALGGIIAVYFFSKLFFREEKKAFISACVLLSSCLYIGLARTVFTDMVFSVLILFSLLSFYWGYAGQKHKRAGLILFFVFCALAVLAKGPLGLVIPLSVVIVFLLLTRGSRFILCKDAFWGMIIFLAIALPWYIFMSVKYNQGFIREFFYNDHFRRLIQAEHSGNDKWYFYPLTMIGCMFPWSIFVGVALFYAFRHLKKANNAVLFLVCWISVTFLIFEFAHSKLTSYVFPVFPAMAMVCGSFIFDSITGLRKQRHFFLLSGIMWFIFLLMVFGIVIFGLKFSYYFSSVKPLYFLISALILWLAITGYFLLKNRSFTLFYLFAFFIPIFMCIIPLVIKDIDPYFSSKYPCEYLLKNYSLDKHSYLLCSKAFVRGARFYTDMNVAVFGSDNFFSPHPIPFLNSNEQIREFLHKHPVTYGFLKKSHWLELKRLPGNEFEYQLLRSIGNQYIIKIEPK
jgi:hypothetical protein